MKCLGCKSNMKLNNGNNYSYNCICGSYIIMNSSYRFNCDENYQLAGNKHVYNKTTLNLKYISIVKIPFVNIENYDQSLEIFDKLMKLKGFA